MNNLHPGVSDAFKPTRIEPVAETVRPLSYWLATHPPAFVSRQAAGDVAPMSLAFEIHVLGAAFVQWLDLSPARRWDSYALQRLSAALFSRFRKDADGDSGSELTLLELAWPPESAKVCRHLRRLQKLLAGPFAVFRAVRTPLSVSAVPSAKEFRLAEDAIERRKSKLTDALKKLGQAIDDFAANAKR